MAYDDLRSFLDTLDKEGQLLRITEELSPEPDLAAAANAVTRLGDSAPALFFTNVKGFTSARIAMNVHGSWANHALALGLPKGTGTRAQVDEFIARWAKFPVKPEWRDNPPWAQNSQDGDDVNIFEVLPLVRLNDGDGGFYIDKAAVISKDPDDPENSDKQNAASRSRAPASSRCSRCRCTTSPSTCARPRKRARTSPSRSPWATTR
jgi:vanillate/4-hydroxybenzoate decarboxylase subunit C